MEVCHSHLKNQLISPFFLLIKILKSQLFFIYLQYKIKNFHIDTNQEGGNLLFI